MSGSPTVIELEKKSLLSSHPSDTLLPHTLQVAHWLYEQQRPVSPREAANLLGGSTWSMWQTFSKIRLLSNILIIDEQLVPARGGQQSLMRILHIYPYTLDEHQQPHRQRTYAEQHDVPLTWRDLLCRSWAQLVQMYQSRLDRDN